MSDASVAKRITGSAVRLLMESVYAFETIIPLKIDAAEMDNATSVGREGAPNPGTVPPTMAMLLRNHTAAADMTGTETPSSTRGIIEVARALFAS